MSYSIDEIKGLMNAKDGAAKPNLFRVQLPSLPGATSAEVNILCTAANLPGKGIVTYDRDIGIRRDRIAYGQIYEDLTLTFLLLNDYGIRKYFETWQEWTVSSNYQISYKNEYAKQLKVSQLKKGFGQPVYGTPLGIPKLPAAIQSRLPKIGPFDFAQGEIDLNFISGNQDVFTMNFEDAFPISITGSALSNAANDTVSELNVTFAYTKYTTLAKGESTVSKYINNTINDVLTSVVNRLI
tara:strand:+ start:29405 stop:30124 length:720 start_codon:yes stop_codon:yes gene_type:complete